MAKSTNIDATWLDATVETTETTVAHGLDRTPVEAFVLRQGNGANVYRGSTAWDATNIYVQASAQVLVRFLIF